MVFTRVGYHSWPHNERWRSSLELTVEDIVIMASCDREVPFRVGPFQILE